ncbi:MAG: hypothetical protein AB1646_08880 [Thermodesulfobacteriota bacterium]
MGTVGLIQIVLAIVLVAIGVIAAVLMLEVLGRPGRAENPSGKRAIHRLLGWVFIVLYLIMFVWMLPKAAWYSEQNEPYSSRAFAHIFLALSLVPLLVAKVATVRRYKAFMQSAPLMGVLIASLTYLLVALTAGHDMVGMLKSFR